MIDDKWKARTQQALRRYADQIHEQCVAAGRWDAYPHRADRWKAEGCMLVISEIAEAMEGHRKGLMDDKLPEYPMFHVELADAMIRLLDASGPYPKFWDAWVEDLPFAKDATSIPAKLRQVCLRLCQKRDSASIRCGMALVLRITREEGIHNFWSIVYEKVEYNRTRADHQREHRAKAGGKKY